jgi:hypothetical protein
MADALTDVTLTFRNVRSDMEITDTDRAIADLKVTKLRLSKEMERVSK